MEEYCVCGHKFRLHAKGRFSDDRYECRAGAGDGFHFIDNCMKFQLDNLRFVEDEAKRRNLIN